MMRSQESLLDTWQGIRVLPFDFFYQDFVSNTNNVALNVCYNPPQSPLKLKINFKYEGINQLKLTRNAQILTKTTDKTFLASFTQPSSYTLSIIQAISCKNYAYLNKYLLFELNENFKNRTLLAGAKYFSKNTLLDFSSTLQFSNQYTRLSHSLTGFVNKQKYYLSLLGIYSKRNLFSKNQSIWMAIVGYKINRTLSIFLYPQCNFQKARYRVTTGFVYVANKDTKIGAQVLFTHKQVNMNQTFFVIQRYFADKKNLFKVKLDRASNITLSIRFPILDWPVRITSSISLRNLLKVDKNFGDNSPPYLYSLKIDII